MAARFFCGQLLGIAHALRCYRFFRFWHFWGILLTPPAITFGLIFPHFFALLGGPILLIGQPTSPNLGGFGASRGTITTKMMFRPKTPLATFEQARSGRKLSLANLPSWPLWCIVYMDQGEHSLPEGQVSLQKVEDLQ